MKNLSNAERKRQKREAILTSAREVFRQKGLIDVTMKDIIEATGISRGGIYLYFDSVDQIFMEVIKQRSNRKFDAIRHAITKNPPFEELLNDYFESHEDRLLNQMENSLLRSMYEYYFTHKTSADHKFQQEQLAATKNTILAILELGVAQGVLKDEQIPAIAENFMFVIEGMSVMALTGGITAPQLTAQFDLMRKMLPKKAEQKRRT
ncbi:putative HTH-type transcriptional regulator YfiR [Enterococcus saigonensis]|uniref:Putative HTH-type transcriptional regulator YfiR n=1 Tax=Enterococcus saigonensis TaxID=1805431 RepID=A0A679IFJ1_9ENTE|nr:TetR/AcrR family transcriptional regulator [Enterococcus saigonensis]BCA86903.1 putative HTH-type transcriptional regulator YfiR [Enterococcus saigonensis]